jgi:hypothetical protein
MKSKESKEVTDKVSEVLDRCATRVCKGYWCFDEDWPGVIKVYFVGGAFHLRMPFQMCLDTYAGYDLLIDLAEYSPRVVAELADPTSSLGIYAT